MSHVGQSHVCVTCDRVINVSCVTESCVCHVSWSHVCVNLCFNYECQNVICCRVKCLPCFTQSSTYSSISPDKYVSYM